LRDRTGDTGLTLYDAARAMGVSFAGETRPEDRTVEVNGLRFHYLEWGGADNPPLLLLHGFAQTCHSWDFISLSLADRFHVHALDQRGHGDSSWAPDGNYSPETQQTDIHGVVEALDLRDFLLMGLSMGGRNSFTYAANHPERVKALVVVDAAPENMAVGGQNIRRFVQGDDELPSVESFVDRVLEFNRRRDRSQVRGSIRHNLKQLPSGKWTWKYDKLLRSSNRPLRGDDGLSERLWSYLGQLKCPTLVVRGSHSDIVAQNTFEEMSSRIPLGRVVTVENAGHIVPGDNPAGFQAAVLSFVDGLD
jgi:pimeloyl-ACP methyl ester carboxylesterase